ncbi:MAG TPA: type II secretion system protein GspG [Kofleriaceae bacterium]
MRFPPGLLSMSSVFAATMCALLIAGLVTGQRVGSHGRGHGEPKEDVAKLTAQKFAFEAYPEWAMENPDRACPTSLRELDLYMDRYMDKAAREDPWGREYMFTCSDGKLYVVSIGEDGKADTADDIWSHNGEARR